MIKEVNDKEVELTEREKSLYVGMLKSERMNGKIIVPPFLAGECNRILEKLRRGK